MKLSHNDKQILSEAYGEIIEAQAPAIKLQKTGPLTVNWPGLLGIEADPNKDISELLYQLTQGGNEKLKIWTIRANDKVVKGIKVASAGDVVEGEGRLGTKKGDNRGIGNNQGTPEDKYQNYNTIMVNVLRNGKYQTRQFKVPGIFKVAAAGRVFEFVD